MTTRIRLLERETGSLVEVRLGGRAPRGFSSRKFHGCCTRRKDGAIAVWINGRHRPWSPGFMTTLVHELSHAVDFVAGRLPPDDETRAETIGQLVGDATRFLLKAMEGACPACGLDAEHYRAAVHKLASLRPPEF